MCLIFYSFPYFEELRMRRSEVAQPIKIATNSLSRCLMPHAGEVSHSLYLLLHAEMVAASRETWPATLLAEEIM